MRRLKAAGRPAAKTVLLLALACKFASAAAAAGQFNQTHAAKPARVKARGFIPRADAGYDRVGVASWYGPGFHGRRTASGETFDMNALTAAHPNLPLATKVRVTNLENGRSVVVRVNDRGPYARGRIIDMSHAGARALGFDARGTAPVRVTVLDKPTDEPSVTTSAWPRRQHMSRRR